MKTYKKAGIVFSVMFFVVFAMAVVITIKPYINMPVNIPGWDDIAEKVGLEVKADKSSAAVHFIDCGQGDSELIKSGDNELLIDSGTEKSSSDIIRYLKHMGVKEIDHFVLTHPHEDHIGGALSILDNFKVKNIYMKKPKEGEEPTTSTYRRLLDKISEKNMKITDPKIDDRLKVGEFEIIFLGPIKEYKETNDQSIVLKAVNKETSFLFTGDAEKEPETDMVKKYGNKLNANVLKAGHHGSKTSSSNSFIKAVNPEYAVISCGFENSYGHPSGKILALFNKNKIKTMRTDLAGDIIAYTNGKDISFRLEKK